MQSVPFSGLSKPKLGGALLACPTLSPVGFAVYSGYTVWQAEPCQGYFWYTWQYTAKQAYNHAVFKDFKRERNTDMKLDIITKEDLQQFKTELFTELKGIIGEKKETDHRQWLKSAEVRKMLNISAGTLQNLRIKGTLPFRKIGGSMYYNRSVIEKIMEGEGHGK